MFKQNINNNKKVSLIASDNNWIEGLAIQQLEQTADLPNMKLAVGMPDLHPGKGNPIGAAFISENVFYPYLVGSDVGCGIGLWQTDLKTKKAKRDNLAQRLVSLETPWEGNINEYLEQREVYTTSFDAQLGTIGAGNHFAELQIVEKVINQEIFSSLGLNEEYLMLLIHSGSRGLGHSLLLNYIEKYKALGLTENTDDASSYLQKHNNALKWSKANRALIAQRFLSCLNADAKNILDVCHNSVQESMLDGCSCWIHRKGAAPSNEGPVMIPGSRGTFSYLVQPKDVNQSANAFSVAHGAGRKWKRSESKQRLCSKYKPASLAQTELGSVVICEDKNLLFEEAPQAYKDIDIVVQDLVSAGLVEVIAILRPFITYKTRRKEE